MVTQHICETRGFFKHLWAHNKMWQTNHKKCKLNSALWQLWHCTDTILPNVKHYMLHLGPVHTNPFSNENGAVLLRFQKDLRPHLLFWYRFYPSTLQHHICFRTLLYPQCAWSNELDACAFQYIGPQNWREIEATW